MGGVVKRLFVLFGTFSVFQELKNDQNGDLSAQNLLFWLCSNIFCPGLSGEKFFKDMCRIIALQLKNDLQGIPITFNVDLMIKFRFFTIEQLFKAVSSRFQPDGSPSKATYWPKTCSKQPFATFFLFYKRLWPK